ncbi:NADPH:quinone oxidoreductase family protein [Parvularcula maris]|uniref:NADPH:quinone oxidoreductase family protein n=1 Tax=Parvularcula maris TaxID=2965077 RepID=A0A9X2RH41_9PROT|nr:NADPH:quinone oxidoreductase family protein [Parvularcula maris]MCQ8184515.1 NADPH:quinone oxidoreductase family protein [Parvularcula maris]
MRALMSVTPGGPETLELREMETPVPGKGQALVRIHAAGCNFPDTLIIKDLYQFKPKRPFAPGGEAAGVVEAVGEGADERLVGQRVATSVGAFGGYATHALVDAGMVMPIPEELPFDVAAGFIMTYGTSYYALKDRAKLQRGETLVVLGAAGGVGSAAVELGKAMGAKVVACVSSESKAKFCRALGADETIVYPRELDRDASKLLAGAIKEKTGGGADVLYDPVGGAYCEPALRAMAWEGRYLVVGFPAGIPNPPLNLTLLKSCQIMGVFWGAAVMRDPAGHAQNMGEITTMMKEGTLKPRITKTFPLEEGAEALKLLEGREATGKIVLTMG